MDIHHGLVLRFLSFFGFKIAGLGMNLLVTDSDTKTSNFSPSVASNDLSLLCRSSFPRVRFLTTDQKV